MAAKRRIVKAHKPDSEDSFIARAGDVFGFERRPTEWKGWIWCFDGSGNSGWVPESWVYVEGSSCTFLRDYDSHELNVKPGDEFEILEIESEWAFGKSSKGLLGWIPEDCLESSGISA